MKKILSFIFIFSFFGNCIAASYINIINATDNFTLYFNLVAKKSVTCYPEFREYNPNGPNGYCLLAAGGSLNFNSYVELNQIYPGLTFTRKTSSTSEDIPVLTANLANSFMNGVNADWTYIIAKVQNNYTTEGSWISFWDYEGCNGYSDSWAHTYTESMTFFEIGDERYFIVGSY